MGKNKKSKQIVFEDIDRSLSLREFKAAEGEQIDISSSIQHYQPSPSHQDVHETEPVHNILNVAATPSSSWVPLWTTRSLPLAAKPPHLERQLNTWQRCGAKIWLFLVLPQSPSKTSESRGAVYSTISTTNTSLQWGCSSRRPSTSPNNRAASQAAATAQLNASRLQKPTCSLYLN